MSKIVDLINEWADNSEVDILFVGGSLTNCSKETREQVERYAPAILGITDGHWNDDRVAIVYDEDKMIEIIAEDMEPSGAPDDPDDEYNTPFFLAREHFDFNFKGGWHGEHTPIFINTFAWELELDEHNGNGSESDSGSKDRSKD